MSARGPGRTPGDQRPPQGCSAISALACRKGGPTCPPACYNVHVNDPRQIELLRLLAARLERLSADSRWARRASGLRGNLLKVLEEADSGQLVAQDRLDLLTGRAFEILRLAAHEIPDLDIPEKKG